MQFLPNLQYYTICCQELFETKEMMTVLAAIPFYSFFGKIYFCFCWQETNFLNFFLFIDLKLSTTYSNVTLTAMDPARMAFHPPPPPTRRIFCCSSYFFDLIWKDFFGIIIIKWIILKITPHIAVVFDKITCHKVNYLNLDMIWDLLRAVTFQVLPYFNWPQKMVSTESTFINP